MAMRITVIGNTYLDSIGYGIRQKDGVHNDNTKAILQHGGIGRNIAENLGNMEMLPVLVSQVSDDAIGKDFLDKLTRHHCDIRYVKQVKNGLGLWIAILDEMGRIAADSITKPDPAGILDTLERHGDLIFRNASVIAMEFGLSRPIYKRVFTLAKKYRKPVIGCIANINEAIKWRDFLPEFDMFICNCYEAGIFLGSPLSDLEPLQIASRLPRLMDQAEVKRIIITLGAKGAVYGDIRRNTGFVPQKQQVPSNTSGIGKGEAFFSGAVAAISCNLSMEKACEIGNRVAVQKLIHGDNVTPRFNPRELGLKPPR